MQLWVVKIDYITFFKFLPSYIIMKTLNEGMNIHQRVVKNGFSFNVMVVDALIDMYEKYGWIHKVRIVWEYVWCRYNFMDYNDHMICTKWIHWKGSWFFW